MLDQGHSEIHEELGIPGDYAVSRDLPAFAEESELVDVGPNLLGRMQRLHPSAAAKWQQMIETAAGDGIRLLIVSGFRSYQYQAELIRNKLKNGQNMEEILKVSAAPGYSEHHTGLAVDIASPGSRPLTEEFEASEAFAWLSDNAETFGFSMTYPRDNRYGFDYEPWHWSIKGQAQHL
jgi:D-alanyl-D-alanine carboxypeptidase